VSEKAKPSIQLNGHKRAGAEGIPISTEVANDRAMHETPMLHSGARLAAKLKAKIIVNDTEFDHAGELSVDDRHLYHEALEALFPPGVAVCPNEAGELKRKKVLLIGTMSDFARQCLSLTRRLLRLQR
jgi:hypothetical protein